MKKKIIIALTGIVSLFAAVAVVSTFDAQACKKCNQDDSNRKCGECGSSRLFVEKSWVNSAGKMRYYFKCRDCEHDFIASSTGAIIIGEEVPQD